MTPPRLALWLLQRCLDRDAAEAVSGDLVEEFHARAGTGRGWGARRWFWQQTMRSIAARARRQAPLAQHASTAGAGFMSALTQDVRYAIRSYRRAPGFTLAAIATLAVGIGAATAIATSAERVLRRPLPYPSADRLVHLGHPHDNRPGAVANVGFLTVQDWRARLTTLDELAIVRSWTPTFAGDHGAERVTGLRVSWNFFRMLGVRPALGRDFIADDDRPDTWRVLIIAHDLWERRYGRRPDVIGQSVEFNGAQATIVGVLPKSFEPVISQHFYVRAEVWAPLGYGPADRSACRSCQHLKTVGRLRPGAVVEDVRRELALVHDGLRREHPADYTETPPGVISLHTEIAGPLQRPLELLMLAVAFVLLVACANVAGLLIARAADREREMAVRSALGASRRRLTRQLLTESVLLAGLAALAGIGLARLGLGVLASAAPASIPRLDRAAADPWVLIIGVGVATLAVVGFAVIPAWSSARQDVQSVLREGRQSSGRNARRARELLLVVQVSVAVCLVAGAGLMVRTVTRLLDVDPGFNPRGVVTMGLSLVGPRWAEDSAVRTFHDDLLHRIRALPGVQHAALAGQIPLGNNYDRWGFRVEGRTLVSEADAPDVERYSVTPDYFVTMGIPLKRGRLFDATDGTDAPHVLLVSDTAASTLFPGEDPIGRRVRIGGGSDSTPWRTIVGIVGDVRHYQLDQAPTAQFYAPQTQMTDSFLVLAIRAAGDSARLVAATRREVAALGPDVPVYDVATLDGRMRRSIAERSFLAMLLAVFAGAALVMASVGLYGVIAQGVAARQREFGIRVALGARTSDVVTLVLRRGAALVGAGLAIGLAAAAGLGHLLRTHLFEVAPTDPLTMSGAVAALVAAAALAHVVPLRRATRVDPTVTLRAD